jgi:DNA-binding XRE family transcriptional regulator
MNMNQSHYCKFGEDVKIEIGLKMKKQRVMKRMTQDSVADELGVTRQTISNWESGRDYPSLRMFISWCKVLKVKSGDILDDLF